MIKLRHSFQELKKSNVKERIYFVIHFIICFLVDAIVMLGTYWVASINEKDFKLGKNYCYGVKVGSAYLVIFMLISNIKLPKAKHWGLENTLNFMKKYTIFYLTVAVICFIVFE